MRKCKHVVLVRKKAVSYKSCWEQLKIKTERDVMVNNYLKKHDQVLIGALLGGRNKGRKE